MTRIIVSLIVLLIPGIARAVSYTCTYPSYLGKEPILIKVSVDTASAKIGEENYTVLQNTNLGIVLVRSFANFNKYTNQNDLGLFGVVINKKNLHFTRGNILDSESDNSIAEGKCVEG